MLDPTDLSPADREKGLAAARALRLETVREGAAFDAAYDLLATYFADRGELEPREVLARFAAEGTAPTIEGVVPAYHVVGAYEGDELVGVRDCYVDVDLAGQRCLVSLAHSFVVPRWRRRGLAALFRALPSSLGRAAAQRLLGRAVPTMVVAEMEPADRGDPDTLHRLVAYGRSGFAVLDPARVPYSQPNLTPGATGALPLLAVVRTEGLPAGHVPTDLAAWFPTMFHVTHESYLGFDRVEPSRSHALATLARSPDPVRLLPLPTSDDDEAALAPLWRPAVHAHYPAALRGDLTGT